jgi:hypothetical protein
MAPGLFRHCEPPHTGAGRRHVAKPRLRRIGADMAPQSAISLLDKKEKRLLVGGTKPRRESGLPVSIRGASPMPSHLSFEAQGPWWDAKSRAYAWQGKRGYELRILSIAVPAGGREADPASAEMIPRFATFVSKHQRRSYEN